jgi:hypothetical protein
MTGLLSFGVPSDIKLTWTIREPDLISAGGLSMRLL